MARRHRCRGPVETGDSQSERHPARRLPPFPGAVSFVSRFLGLLAHCLAWRRLTTAVSGGRSSKRRLETQALGNINNGARVTLSKDVDAQRKFLRFRHHETRGRRGSARIGEKRDQRRCLQEKGPRPAINIPGPSSTFPCSETMSLTLRSHKPTAARLFIGQSASHAKRISHDGLM